MPASHTEDEWETRVVDKPCIYREGAGLQLCPESPGEWKGCGGGEQVVGIGISQSSNFRTRW